MFQYIKDHLKKGQLAENFASEYLKNQGLKRLQTNFACKHGEVDLIMLDDNTLVFVEVRYRQSTDYGHPLETINYAKQQKILKTVQFFLLKHPEYRNHPCRIDAIAIDAHTQKHNDTVQWIKNAIQG
jgi:putative endonuclease